MARETPLDVSVVQDAGNSSDGIEAMRKGIPTVQNPTALWFAGRPVVYWREGERWVARELGAKNLLRMTPELEAAIEKDQRHASEKT